MADKKKTVVHCQFSSQRMLDAAKKAIVSTKSARSFLKSAGIMTPKGNLSPKYR